MIATSAKAVTESYGFTDVANILGVAESKLRYWAQIGFVGPSTRGEGKALYTFHDLVTVKAAKELLDRGFKTQEIRQALRAAQSSLPGIESTREALRHLRVAFDGKALVVVNEGVAYETSGQRVFDFGLGELAEKASATIEAMPLANSLPTLKGRKPSAYDWFVQGLQLQGKGGRDDEAIACYRQAISADPGLAAAHTNLGLLSYHRGDLESAKTAFEKALQLDPEQAEARYNLANLLLDADDLEAAVSELRLVLQSAPEFADAHYNLASALERLGGKAQARAHLESYLAIVESSDVPQEEKAPWIQEVKKRLEVIS